MLFMGYTSWRAMTTILEAWSREQVRSYIRFLWPKNVSIIEIHRHLMEVCCGDVVRVQRVKKMAILRDFRLPPRSRWELRGSVSRRAPVDVAHQGRTVNTQHSGGIEFWKTVKSLGMSQAVQGSGNGCSLIVSNARSRLYRDGIFKLLPRMRQMRHVLWDYFEK
jgi:hypothetical protein